MDKMMRMYLSIICGQNNGLICCRQVKFSEVKNGPLAFELLNNCGGDNHEGFIGLQDHGDDVWFRNIRVKVLD